MLIRSIKVFSILIIILLIGISACAPEIDLTQPVALIDRLVKIPADAVKILPETDSAPPEAISNEYSHPIPVPGEVNTAGGEDSAFIMPDGKTLYFWFTPDVSLPVQTQVSDGVTGIYVSHLADGSWSEPERVILQEPGKLAGDGCEFVLNTTMWFCTVREGYTGLHWFTAEKINGTWQNWQLADFNPDYQVGELHISADGTQLFFASDRTDGMGERDIWMSHWAGDHWGEPQNLAAVNTIHPEGWPALNPGGDELWISRSYGLWRSKLIDGEWTEPELMISPLAGEASIDEHGNVYFTHHFFDGDVMLEADIYVAFRKK